MAHEISETWRVSGREDETPRVLAEAYVLGRLTAEHHEEYEAHLLVCGTCHQEVETLTDFIETLRLAADGMDPLPLWATLAGRHQTVGSP